MNMPNMKLKNSQEILQKIKVLRENYLEEWNPVEGDAGWAIAQSFSTMGEGLNSTLQRLPNKLFLYYLDTLGFTQSPPLFATAPVTFKLTKGFKRSVVIPKKTELITKDKVSYETANSFTATSAKLSALLCVDTLNNSVSDVTDKMLNEESITLFKKHGEQQYLYFGDDNLFNVHRVLGDKNAYIEYMVPNIENLRWEYFGQSETSGEADWIKFDGKGERLNKKEAFKTVKTVINGIESYWIRIVLAKPKKEQVLNYDISYRSRSGIDALYYNAQPLDPRKRIYLFGKTPQRGDNFYITSSEAFSKKGALCGISMDNISCTEEDSGNVTLKQVGKQESGSVSFEYYNGSAWKKLILKKNVKVPDWINKSINITFNIPLDMQEVNINGDVNYWIRIKLIESSYGAYGYDNINNKVINLFSPPSTTRIDIYVDSKKQIPQYVIRNALANYTDLLSSTQSKPYLSIEDSSQYENLLYLGFDKPFDEGLISMLFSIEKDIDIKRVLECSLYSDAGWSRIAVKDMTDGLTKSGLYSFVAPLNQKLLDRFGKELYWLRIAFIKEVEPIHLRGIYMNSVMVTQCTTIEKRLLGSSNGSAFQTFKLQDAPALELKLWVHEKYIPPKTDYYHDEYGEGYWVEWGEGDRKYSFDEGSGEVKFGDGNNGMIPPIGKNNILVSYKIGGGITGNVDRGVINKLSSSLAYVDKVTNNEAASGGADEQSIETLTEQAPKRIKHGYEAVTSDDFSALVKEASSSVAKVKTVSKAGLVELIIMPFSQEKKPLASEGLRKRVHEYIESRSPATAEISVRNPNYKGIDIEMIVVVDDWSFVSNLRNSIEEAINKFLHPLNGGVDAKGWSFGEVPTLADIFNLLGTFDEISYIESAEIRVEGIPLYDLDGEPKTEIERDVMIYSADHTIDIVVRSK